MSAAPGPVVAQYQYPGAAQPAVAGAQPGGGQMIGQPANTVGQPIGGQPIGGQPIGGQPIGGQPIGGQPIGGQPMGGQPIGGQPMGGPQPVGVQPGVGGGVATPQANTVGMGTPTMGSAPPTPAATVLPMGPQPLNNQPMTSPQIGAGVGQPLSNQPMGTGLTQPINNNMGATTPQRTVTTGVTTGYGSPSMQATALAANNMYRPPMNYGAPSPGGMNLGMGMNMYGYQPAQPQVPPPVTSVITQRVPLKDTRVRAVTVYWNRAEITRSVPITLQEPGYHDITITGVSDAVEPSSWRVGLPVDRMVPVTIYDVRYGQVTERTTVDNPALEQQRSDLIQLHALKNKFSDAIKRSEKELELVEKFANKITSHNDASGAQRSATAAALSREYLQSFDVFLDLYQKRLAEHDAKKAELEAKIEDVGKRITALTTEIDGKSQVKETVLRAVTIEIYNQTPIQFALDLFYFVSNASWRPCYDVRVNSKDPTLNITYEAKVKQDTGEDWNDVYINLSTGVPTYDGEPPTLPVERIGFKSGVESPSTSAAALAEPAAGPQSNVLRPTVDTDDYDDVESASANTKVACATFSAARSYTILANKKAHKVSISSHTLQSEFLHFITPRCSPYAYLQSRTINNTQQPFLAGTIKVFTDSIFITHSRMPLTNPQDVMELFLGADPAIKIEYKQLVRAPVPDSSKKVQIMRYAFQTVIRNSKNVAPIIVIQESMPVSSDPKEIKVKLVEPDPKGEQRAIVNADTGSVSWRIRMAGANNSVLPDAMINFAYTVESPVAREIEFA